MSIHISNNNFFSEHCNVILDEAREGYARAHIDIKQIHYNPFGAIHGGCLFTLADEAGGYAAKYSGASAVTLDANIHFLNPALGVTRLNAEATLLKKGKRVLVFEVSIFDQDDKLLVKGTFSYMAISTS